MGTAGIEPARTFCAQVAVLFPASHRFIAFVRWLSIIKQTETSNKKPTAVGQMYTKNYE